MTDLAKKRVNHEDLYRIPESMTEESHDLVSAPRAWICEILSPATAQVDRAEKMPIHARHAIFHAGLIDPMLKALEVFRFEPDKWAVPGAGYAKSSKIRAEPFSEVELDLGLPWLV